MLFTMIDDMYMGLKEEALGNFTDLTTENMNEILSRPDLMESSVEHLDEDLQIAILGHCFMEPGWKVVEVCSEGSSVDLLMSVNKFDTHEHRRLAERYPENVSDDVVHIRLGWSRFIKLEEFFVDLKVRSISPSEPFHSPIPQYENFTIFPRQELNTMQIEWGFNQNSTKLSQELDSDYVCALELFENADMTLWSSYIDVHSFQASENEKSALIWRPTNALRKSQHSAKRKRVFVKKDAQAAYVLDALRHDNKVYFYGLVLV